MRRALLLLLAPLLLVWSPPEIERGGTHFFHDFCNRSASYGLLNSCLSRLARIEGVALAERDDVLLLQSSVQREGLPDWTKPFGPRKA